MRILHIDMGREMRGGQRQTLLLMEGLRGAGHTSVLLSRPGSPLAKAASTLELTIKAANLRSLWLESARNDLVHAHDAHAHTLAALTSRQKFVVSRRVAFPIRRGAASRWKYSRPSRFLAVSQFVAQELERAGVSCRHIDVVYDGLRPARSAMPDWKSEFPVVAIASRDPRKGRDLLKQAASLAGFPLVFSDNLAQDLKRASVFAYITRSEGFGSAVLLAMSMGVPVIASRVGGLPEVVFDGTSGLVVSNDPPEIASAVTKIRENSVLAQTLIQNGRLRFEQNFTATHLIRATLASYERALAG